MLTILLVTGVYLYGAFHVIDRAASDPVLANDPTPDVLKLIVVWLVAISWPLVYLLGALWMIAGYFDKR